MSDSLKIEVTTRASVRRITTAATRILVYFLLAMVMLGAYLGWLPGRFETSTLLILALVAFDRGAAFATVLGLRMRKRDAIASLLLVLGLGLIVVPLIHYTAHYSHAYFYMSLYSTAFLSVTVFQVLNEEMVLRALLLHDLASLLDSRLMRGAVCGAAFGLLHLGFYGHFDGYWLAPTTVVTLAAFGTVANLVVLHTRHIGYTFAFHVAWNFARFTGGSFVEQSSGQPLTEGKSFDAIEGALPICVIALAALAVALWFETRAKSNTVDDTQILYSDKKSESATTHLDPVTSAPAQE